MIKFYLTIITIILFTSCAQKTRVKAIKASQINDSSIRYIGVAKFQNDTVSQSSQIESALNSVIFNSKKYFNIIDRKNIDLVMQEKKLNDSGLVDLLKDNSSVGLSQMQALLTGKILLNDMSSTLYYQQRTNYDICIKSYEKGGKTYCSKYKTYKVSCRKRNYSLKTYIKIIKISNGSTLFAKTYSKQTEYEHCSDDSNSLPSKKYVNTILAKLIAKDIIKDIAPSYVYYDVTILDDLDIDLTSAQEILFDNALKMIELKRLQKANQMLQRLDNQTEHQSYVIIYDLAITYEALGNIKKAHNLLLLAENIAIDKGKIIDEITTSIHRVQKSINERTKASKVF